MNLRQAEKVAICNVSPYNNSMVLSGGARWKRVRIFPAKNYSSVFLKHTESSPISRLTLDSSGRNCKSIVLDRRGRFHCVPLVEENPSTAITLGSPLICEGCHGFGYEEIADAKVASEKCLISDQIFYLATAPEVINFETNGVPTVRRKLRFAIVQGIEQQTGLELISDFRIDKTVDETLDSDFF